MLSSKFKIVLVMCVLLFVSCSSSSEGVMEKEVPEEVMGGTKTPNPEPDEEIVVSKEWSLIFEENFDTNFEKWNIWKGGAFNNEIQLYQESQSTIKDGFLTIKAVRKNVSGPTNIFESTPKNFQYVSGRLESKEQFGPSNVNGEREYRIMASIKMPPGKGMWPAFWTYADPWPTQGEIDIIEARGNEPRKFQSNLFYGVKDGVKLTRDKYTKKTYNLAVDITKDFHQYEVIWKADKLIIKFDDRVLHTYIADSKNFIRSFFNKKHQIVLNLAVGGAFFKGVDPATFVDSSEMVVDWVKVYKK